MALYCECINVFVRLDRLERAVPGVRTAASSEAMFPGFWHDGELARIGAMNDFDAHLIVTRLNELGLKPGRDFGGFDLPWLDTEPEGFLSGAVALKGGHSRVLVGPHNFDAFLDGKLVSQKSDG